MNIKVELIYVDERL